MCNKDTNVCLTCWHGSICHLLAALSTSFPQVFFYGLYWDDVQHLISLADSLMFCRQMSNKHLTFATDAPYFRWSRPAVAPCEGAVFWCSNSRNNTPNLWYTKKSLENLWWSPIHFHGIFVLFPIPMTDPWDWYIYLHEWLICLIHLYI